ncbi:MAG: VTT domain-containing protein [Pyrinomonadaceae bacterium]|jgi:uncharacterized membrane protein YdjX (TVP38/TMEM64 family)|nr:VTT domain-containing protein [Pyrinomonadaceae bacterium]
MKLQNIIEKFKSVKKDFGKIGSMAGLTAFLPIVGSAVLIALVYQISPWLQQNKEIGIFLFVTLMSILSGFALLATNVLGIVSGFAFSFQLGLIAQMLGIIGASSIMYLLAKRYATKNFLSTIEERPKMKAIHKALLDDNIWKTLMIITLVRLSPALPFALTNFMISAAGISFKTFIIGTVLGMLPRASAVVFVGSSLSELNLSQPQESWVIILGIIATILAVIVVSIISKRALNRLTLEQGV